MAKKHVHTFLKIFPLAFFFSIAIGNYISCMLITNTNSLISIFDSYFLSGKSIFIPNIPDYNVLSFIPEEWGVFRLNLGHLTDIIIFTNLIFLIDTAIYHYIKKVCYHGDLVRLNELKQALIIPNGEKFEFIQINGCYINYKPFNNPLSDYNELYNRNIEEIGNKDLIQEKQFSNKSLFYNRKQKEFLRVIRKKKKSLGLHYIVLFESYYGLKYPIINFLLLKNYLIFPYNYNTLYIDNITPCDREGDAVYNLLHHVFQLLQTQLITKSNIIKK